MTDRDAGSASLWAVSLAMVLWVCVAGIVLAGVAVVARHRAATAADMSALAAASVIARSEGDRDAGAWSKGCAAATALALDNDAVVTSCQVTGQVVDVTTRVRIPALRWLGGLGLDAVSVRARAGPG
ncbi:MAG TPA: Rv3654c family TadE-like protein [Acidothermaceae bacterium]|nr:Rv3654c family TadE-like protein [Acidothermaceae bacterium]